MSTITVETECGTRQWYDNRRDAEASKRTHQERCDECDEGDVRLAVDPDQSTLRSLADDRRRRADGAGTDTEPSAGSGSASTPDAERPTEQGSRPRPGEPEYPGVSDYADVAVKAEAITTAGETDHEYAEFRATAWRKDEGPENGYTGHATARAVEDRSGIEHRLNEVAETRAMTRAVAWASGRGPTPGEETVASRDGETSGSTEGS